MVVIGGFYLYASRTVAKRLPGHVYEYTSVSGNQNAYMTFATSGDQVVVTPDKDTAIKASNSASDFQQAYQDNAKDGKWNYKAQRKSLDPFETPEWEGFDVATENLKVLKRTGAAISSGFSLLKLVSNSFMKSVLNIFR